MEASQHVEVGAQGPAQQPKKLSFSQKLSFYLRAAKGWRTRSRCKGCLLSALFLDAALLQVKGHVLK